MQQSDDGVRYVAVVCQPLADDDGLDVLFFDKVTGNSVAIQLKCRTVSIRKRNSEERGNVVHFQVRQATFNEARRAYLVAALFNEELTHFVATWFIPMALLPEVGKDISGKWVIRPSKAEGSADRYTPYRCLTAEELANRIIAVCEGTHPRCRTFSWRCSRGWLRCLQKFYEER